MISIAVPAHNEEDSIQRNLQSIISSNLKGSKYEIVVCLSACKDNTQEKIIQFKESHPKVNISIIKEMKIGKVRAYKALDKYIKNKIIVYLDADCGSQNDSIWRIYTRLKNSSDDIKVVSGNAIDTRYTSKNTPPKSLIEAFNRSFWQHPPRKIINGQFFAIRKGVIQMIPNVIKLDDVYLSIKLWNNFRKDNRAKIIQGSAQTMYEVVRYQKNIVAGKKQIKDYLNDMHHFKEISATLYRQFDINLYDKEKYYPNIPYPHLFAIKFLIFIGQLWGNLSQPSWTQTKSSKQIAQT